MKRLPTNSIFWVSMVVAFVCGAGLVGLAAWLRPISDAEHTLAEGNLEAALERYTASEARFDRFPASKRLLPRVYALTLANQLWLMYRLAQYDSLIEKAAVSPPGPAIHFWAGCALYAKARAENQPEARIGWFSRAEEEFRNSLELESENWDAKFNYELTKRLLTELRKQPKTPPQQLMQLLRPQPKEGRPPSRRTG